jgi:hypothetical protein
VKRHDWKQANQIKINPNKQPIITNNVSSCGTEKEKETTDRKGWW